MITGTMKRPLEILGDSSQRLRPLPENVAFALSLGVRRDHRDEQPDSFADRGQNLCLPVIAHFEASYVQPQRSRRVRLIALLQPLGSLGIFTHVADEDRRRGRTMRTEGPSRRLCPDSRLVRKPSVLRAALTQLRNKRGRLHLQLLGPTADDSTSRRNPTGTAPACLRVPTKKNCLRSSDSRSVLDKRSRNRPIQSGISQPMNSIG